VGARLVLVDGSPNGRPESGLTDLFACDDGRRALAITCAWGSTYRVWSYALDDGAPTLVYTSSYPETVLLSRNGRYMVTIPLGAPAMWRDLDTGEGSVVDVPGDQRPLAVSPDGRVLTFIREDDGAPLSRFTFVRVEDGRQVGAPDGVEAPAFDDTGTAFVQTPRGDVLAVSVRDGSTRTLIEGLGESKRASTLHAERGGRRLLVTTSAREVAVIDAASGEIVKTLRFSRDVSVLDFAAGRVLVRDGGARGTTSSIVDVDRGARVALPASLELAALTPDGATVVAFREPVLVAIDVETMKVRPWHDGHDARVTTLVWSRDGSLLASRAEDGVVRVWDVCEGALLWSLEHERGREGPLAFSPDGRLLYALGAHALVAWELATGTEVLRHPEAGHRASAICVSPDGRLLATAGIGMPPRLYDLADGVRCVAKLDLVFGRSTNTGGSDHWTSTLTFGRDGELRVGLIGDYGGCQTWWFGAGGGLARRAQIDVWVAQDGTIEGDSTSVLARRDGAIVRVDLRDGSEVTVCEAPGSERIACASERVVVCEALRTVNEEVEVSALVVIDLTTGREIARLELDLPKKRAVLSPDGAHLAVLSWNGRVEVFALWENDPA
jgi:WD40 repeat protein